MKRQFWSLILAVGMVCGLLAMPASAATSPDLMEWLMSDEGQAWTWTYEGQTAINNNDWETVSRVHQEFLAKENEPEVQRYPDVPLDAWYAEAVNDMTRGGLVKGYDDGLFHPDDEVTAGEFMTILCRIGGKEWTNADFKPHSWFGKIVDNQLVRPYYETPVSWSHWAIIKMYDSQIGTVYPENAEVPVTRMETVNTLMRIVSWHIHRYHENLDVGQPFVQVSEKVWTADDIPDYDFMWGHWNEILYASAGTIGSCDNIINAYNLGITQGVDSDGTFNPMGHLTRAELCQMLYNMGLTRFGCVQYKPPFYM